MDAALAEFIQWIEDGVPVLPATATELARMEREQDHVSANQLAATILRDPLMTLRVLRFLQNHRTRSQTADITTIAHALMMLGQARFFREFDHLGVLDESIGRDAAASVRARELLSQSRLAALFARDWALHRHDIDPEEVMVAALMHGIPDILITLRSAILGSAPSAWHELRGVLLAQLNLPRLIHQLTDEAPSHDSRLLNVRLACRLARHCSEGWDQARIADDLDSVHRVLHISVAELWERVRRILLQAAREWRTYDVRPAAAYLPMAWDASDGTASAMP